MKHEKSNLKNYSLLGKEELKDVISGQGLKKSCPMTGTCSGSCSDSVGNAVTYKTGSSPTHDCLCNTGA